MGGACQHRCRNLPSQAGFIQAGDAAGSHTESKPPSRAGELMEIGMRVVSFMKPETAEWLFGIALAVSLFAMAYLVMGEA